VRFSDCHVISLPAILTTETIPTSRPMWSSVSSNSGTMTGESLSPAHGWFAGAVNRNASLNGVMTARKAPVAKSASRSGRLSQAERRAARANAGGVVLKEIGCRLLRGIQNVIPAFFGGLVPPKTNDPVVTMLHGVAIKNFPHVSGETLTTVTASDPVIEEWCVTNLPTTKSFRYQVNQALTVNNSIDIQKPAGQTAWLISLAVRGVLTEQYAVIVPRDALLYLSDLPLTSS